MSGAPSILFEVRNEAVQGVAEFRGRDASVGILVKQEPHHVHDVLDVRVDNII